MKWVKLVPVLLVACCFLFLGVSSDAQQKGGKGGPDKKMEKMADKKGGKDLKSEERGKSDEARGGVGEKGERKIEKGDGDKQNRMIREENKHMRRMAQIDRIEKLAGENNDAKLLETATKLREKEAARHGRVVERLGGNK